jgi:hypothetical protein
MAEAFSAISPLPRLTQPSRLYHRHSTQKCRSCGHPPDLHVGFADPELAKQLSRIHGGCLDCEICADE